MSTEYHPHISGLPRNQGRYTAADLLGIGICRIPTNSLRVIRIMYAGRSTAWHGRGRDA